MASYRQLFRAFKAFNPKLPKVQFDRYYNDPERLKRVWEERLAQWMNEASKHQEG